MPSIALSLVAMLEWGAKLLTRKVGTIAKLLKLRANDDHMLQDC